MSLKDLQKIMDDEHLGGGKPAPLKVYPTTLDVLDNYLFGIGGIPQGRAVEIAGKYSSGKSTLCQFIAGKIQAQGGYVMWIDLEGTFDEKYAASSGMIFDKKHFGMQPAVSFGEDILIFIKQMLATNAVDLLVIDSIRSLKSQRHTHADLKTKRSMHTDMATPKMWADFWTDLENGYFVYGADGKLLLSDKTTYTYNKIEASEKMIKMDAGPTKKIHHLKYKKTSIFAINHINEPMDAGKSNVYSTAGGERKNFLFSVRLALSSKNVFHTAGADKGELSHRIMKIRTQKSKISIPFRTCEVSMFPDGRLEDLKKAEPKEEEKADG